MIRVLAISPRFAPTNGADTHRLRLLLPHAAEAGWQIEVLAVESNDVDGPKDTWLEQKLPKDVIIHRVRAWSLQGWGLNGLAQRSIWPLWRKGCELLESRQFDLVFFSTTEFALHLLGPFWQRRFGVRFCMDYQDPWVNDYYRKHPDLVPPGGRVKYYLADKFHRLCERYVVAKSAGFMAVSADYLDDLSIRYGSWFEGRPTLVRQFPAEPMELACINAEVNSASENRPSKVWRYIGRGGGDMCKAARAFFYAWECSLEQGLVPRNEIRFEAIGTSYAAVGTGQKTFEPLVRSTELSSLFFESPDRLGYSEMLKSLVDADALVVFGSDDSTYTASKIYPYLLAGKPLLTIFHEKSAVVEIMREVAGGVCVTFTDDTDQEELADAILKHWFSNCSYSRQIDVDMERLSPYVAATQAVEVSSWFTDILRSVPDKRIRK